MSDKATKQVVKPEVSNKDVEVKTIDANPDTLAVKVSKAVAGAAIEDHFLDTVLPTLQHAIGVGRDRILKDADKLSSSKLKDADKLISSKLEGNLEPVVEPLLRKMVREEIVKTSGGAAGLSIELHDPAEQRTTYLSRQHYMFPALLRLLCIRDRNDQPLNIAVTGPAGNGKTSMALNCADALGIQPVLQPFTPQTTKSDLLGKCNAQMRIIAFIQDKHSIKDIMKAQGIPDFQAPPPIPRLIDAAEAIDEIPSYVSFGPAPDDF